MWKYKNADEAKRHPLLRTLNNNIGRQTWEFDPQAGTENERADVEAMRKHFTENKDTQHHPSDAFLRYQHRHKSAEAAKRFPVPGHVDKDGKPLDAEDAAKDEKIVAEHLKAGIAFYASIQQDDGHWAGDYGGPMFLLPGLVIALYTTGGLATVFTEQHVTETIRYLRNHQNQDGGFGLHIEGGSTMFGTGLSYVMGRILGLSPDDPAMAAARNWIHKRGGATFITSWGKFWLAVLGVYDWSGMNPTPPEMWLLPYNRWTGIGFLHPGRFWCHCRMVYLPMSYLYGKRVACHETELTRQLREELYPTPYAQINWDRARNECAQEDLFYPHPLIQDVVWWTLSRVEPFLLGSGLRDKALKECMRHIHYEDENTRYVDIGPVNKVLNLLACWVEDPNSDAYRKHFARVADYLWVAEDGLRMQGYNGSQLWDTSFAVQALAEARLGEGLGSDGIGHTQGDREGFRSAGAAEVELQAVKAKGSSSSSSNNNNSTYQSSVKKGPELEGEAARAFLREVLAPCLRRAHEFVEQSQVIEEAAPPLSEFYRHVSRGAWPFSTRDHGWPISDCSSEGLKAALALAQMDERQVGAPLAKERLRDCVDVILSYQNRDGGMATYENTRSFHSVEILNPAETFGDIMVDYSYVECTSACLTALVAFRRRDPEYRAADLAAALGKAEKFVRSIQKADGSWYGSWAVCFTYGCWFGCTALAASGRRVDGADADAALVKCCRFLVEKQRADGGWGESYLSCQEKVYSQLEGPFSHVVNTAWAMLALMAAGYHRVDPAPLRRAAAFLMNMQGRVNGTDHHSDHRVEGGSGLDPFGFRVGQLSSGDWPQQHISGVFNRNCMITYTNYQNIFPIWALGQYRRFVLLEDE